MTETEWWRAFCWFGSFGDFPEEQTLGVVRAVAASRVPAGPASWPGYRRLRPLAADSVA